jgi:hypothetical protein
MFFSPEWWVHYFTRKMGCMNIVNFQVNINIISLEMISYSAVENALGTCKACERQYKL